MSAMDAVAAVAPANKKRILFYTNDGVRELT